MSFPLMNKRARQGVVIPELSGGVNLRDSVSMINDNQLTDAVNMWFKDGVLKTRPGKSIKKKYDSEEEIWLNETFELSKTEEDAKYQFKHWSGISYNNKELVTVKEVGKLYVYEEKYAQDMDYDTVIHFFLVDEECCQEIALLRDSTPEDFFVTMFASTLYCYTTMGGIYSFKLDETLDAKWEAVLHKAYVPTICTNCRMWGTMPDDDSGKEFLKDPYFTGVQFDGPNLIGTAYKVIYSTANTDKLLDDEDYMFMEYLFPIPIDVTKKDNDVLIEANDTCVTAVLRLKGGNIYTHKVTLSNGEGNEGKYLEDGLQMIVKYDRVTFVTTSGTSPEDQDPYTYTTAKVYKRDYVLNNLEITVPHAYTSEDQSKVFGMTKCEWFGGAASGINGGTRLFLGGNAGDNKNLVVWSGLNNPLYFPENCYFKVGNDSQAVTAFGKQENMLVIFKEYETYFTQYNKNDSITAENLIDQSVVDYSANSVYFPLTLIHSSIGCDCPDTVQLCRNRLVWTNSNGKVYTLTSANQYSERNIYEVGEMIERRLKKELNLKNASSCDWEGHYVLFVNNHAYLMDYNSSGYQYVYSYQKEEGANIRIPWYYWEFKPDEKRKKIFLFTNGLTMFLFDVFGEKNESGEKDINTLVWSFLSDDNSFDETVSQQLPIHSSLTTKLFDFGAAGYRKNVDLVQLSLGNNGGAPISVDFVTDCGTVSEEVTLTSDQTENYTAGYISSVALNPCIRSVVRFGVRLSCEGRLAVGGATLNYRLLGGAR